VERNAQNLTGTREKISGFVLAGGRSSRLGQDKVLLPWNGQTLLSHALWRLQQVCGTVRVCADRNDLQQHLPQSSSLIRDALPDAGPLAGIVAALEKSQTEWNLFLAVDLPLIPTELLQALTARMEGNQAALCIVPQVAGLPQPLCGLYHQSLAHGLRRALEEGKYKIMLALRDAVAGLGEGPDLGTPVSPVELFDARSFAESDLQASDWFLNINTPHDWQRAQELSRLH
jgi:molybdopterin-guanine dinucleotide biosynthesis protein A